MKLNFRPFFEQLDARDLPSGSPLDVPVTAPDPTEPAANVVGGSGTTPVASLGATPPATENTNPPGPGVNIPADTPVDDGVVGPMFFEDLTEFAPEEGPNDPPVAVVPPTADTLQWAHFKKVDDAPTGRTDEDAWITTNRVVETLGTRTYEISPPIVSDRLYQYTVKIKSIDTPPVFKATLNAAGTGVFLLEQKDQDDLLEHERLHFRISEYVAQKVLANFVREYRLLTVSFSHFDKPTQGELNAAVEGAMRPKITELRDLWMNTYWLRLEDSVQQAYDLDTDHSTRPVNQADWGLNYRRYVDAAATAMGWAL